MGSVESGFLMAVKVNVTRLLVARVVGELGKLESVIVCELTEVVKMTKFEDVRVTCPLLIKIEGTSILI